MISYCPACYQPCRQPEVSSGSPLQEWICPYCQTHFSIAAGIVPTSEIEYFQYATALPTEQPDATSHNTSSLLAYDSANDETPAALEILHNQADIEVDDDELQLLEDAPDTTDKRATKPAFDFSSTQPNSRRKQNSPVGGLIGVVFGGLASLPIATAIMWYAMGKDPFRVAPKVAEYVPWIVPEKLAGRSFSNRRFEQPSTESAWANRSNKNTGGTGGAYFDDAILRNAELQEEKTMPRSALVLGEASGEPASSHAPESSEASSVVSSADQENDHAIADDSAMIGELPTSNDVDSATTALPFARDSKPVEATFDEMLLFQNLSKSADAMLLNKDEATLAKFLEDLQLVIDATSGEKNAAVASLQLKMIEEKLNQASDTSLWPALVAASKRHFSTHQAAVHGVVYVDAFERQSTEPIAQPPDIALPSDQFERWLPTERTREPVRSMLVLAEKDASSTAGEGAKSDRFVLIGKVSKPSGDDKPTHFVALVKVQL